LQIHKCREESRKKQTWKSTGNCAAQCKSEPIKIRLKEGNKRETKAKFPRDCNESLFQHIKVLSTCHFELNVSGSWYCDGGDFSAITELNSSFASAWFIQNYKLSWSSNKMWVMHIVLVSTGSLAR